jgi:hypothetical protein
METGRDMEQVASFQASETDPNKEKVQSKLQAFLKKYAKLILLPGAFLFSSIGTAEAQNPNLPNHVDLSNPRMSAANTGSAMPRVPTEVHLGQSKNLTTAEIKPVEVDLRQPKAAPVQPATPVEVTGIPKQPEAKEPTKQPQLVKVILGKLGAEAPIRQTSPVEIHIGQPRSAAAANVEQSPTDVTI